METSVPVRVMAVHRGEWDVAHPAFEMRVSPLPAFARETRVTTGDWLLLNPETRAVVRLLERQSVFQRRTAGHDSQMQLIAANVDTVLVVSSCNKEFNPARLERYLIIARDAGATPVIVLTKADLAEETASYRRAAEQLFPGLIVECLDARDSETRQALAPWCAAGQTVALLGSSGVGKTTLVNTLTAETEKTQTQIRALATAEIREDDAKGRHTTSGRSLHRMASGGWLLDTPGMREVQLAEVEDGLEDVFEDITELAGQCRFADCRHESEPGCAVLNAVAGDTLDEVRLGRYFKLQAEEAFNTQTVAQRRSHNKTFGKLIKDVKKEKKKRQR